MTNMREKYESLSVVALKDLAKARGLKNISALKKAEVVDAMGYENINNQMGCCGKNVSVSVPLMEERMQECARADLIVVGCPMCFTKYDSQPDGKPVVHIAELVAMAAGCRGSLDLHTIRVP